MQSASESFRGIRHLYDRLFDVDRGMENAKLHPSYNGKAGERSDKVKVSALSGCSYKRRKLSYGWPS